MNIISRTTVGYRKAREGKACEDAKLYVKTADAVISAIADGHGDEACVYAKEGAELAVDVAVRLLKKLISAEKNQGEYLNENREKIAKSLICGWVKAVLTDYFDRRSEEATEEEREELIAYSGRLFSIQKGKLSGDEFRALQEKKHKLSKKIYGITRKYGTTLKALVMTEGFIFCLGIGDDDVVGVNAGRTYWLLPKTPQFSTTSRSMCENFDILLKDFEYIYVPFSQGKRTPLGRNFKPDIVMLATDGLRNSYLSDEEFSDKLIDIAEACKNGKSASISRHSQKWIEELTKNSFFQDDISFCLVINTPKSR